MDKKILVINSSFSSNQCLIDLFSELEKNDYFFYLFSSTRDFCSKFLINKWPAQNIYLGPSISNSNLVKRIFFIFFYPLSLMIYLIFLIFYRYSKRIKTIICINWNEW